MLKGPSCLASLSPSVKWAMSLPCLPPGTRRCLENAQGGCNVPILLIPLTEFSFGSGRLQLGQS